MAKKSKKKKTYKLFYCNKRCKEEFKKWSKDNKTAKQFGKISSSQHRCAFCGECLKKKKTVKIV